MKDKELQFIKDSILPKVNKFINKVETGKARSKETYKDMIGVMDFLNSLVIEDSNKSVEKSEANMLGRILTILIESKEKQVEMREIIHDLFQSIEQLETFGMVKVNRSFSGSKVDSLEITKLGREFYKEKILKK